MTELIELSLDKILQTRTYTVMVLQAPDKKISIYMEPHIGHTLQEFFSHEKVERPQTFDFIDQIFLGLDLKIIRVVLHDLQGTTFFAKILFYQKGETLDNLVEVDARPSDSLILALRHKVPIYCTEKILRETLSFEE